MENNGSVTVGTVLPVRITAQMVRGGIASAVDGVDVMGYYLCVFPREKRGQISLTVTSDQGRERTLTYLIGSRTNDDVAALHPGPDHDVNVVYDLVTVQYIADHVRAWLATA